MANDFFSSTSYTPLARLTLARAEDVNAFLTALVAAFDLLPTKARTYEGRVTYCGQASGSVNAETITAPYTITLTDGLWLRYRPGTTNTGPLTINASSLGAIAVVNYAGVALTGGEARAGTVIDLVYVSASNHYRIINPLVDVAAVTAFDIAGLTVGTVVDPVADRVPMYDASAGQNVGVTVENLISEYTIMLKSQMFAGS